jgi:REP element-mobilizing transposase RayT
MSYMVRKLRNLEQADWFHIYNRGADQQDIFSLAGDRELFEFLIGQADAFTSVEVHAYALMTNHFHFLIFDPNGEIPAFMQLLCGRYALAYNSRTQRTGPLFSGRYGSVPIVDDRHLLIEARYVERNPLHIVSANALTAYRYSSLGTYVGSRMGPEWLHTNVLLPMMEGSSYLDFVVDAHESDPRPPIQFPTMYRPGVADLFQATRDACGVDIRTQSGPARNVALAIAFELRLAVSNQLADVLGITAAGVRMAARRGRILADTDESMASLKRRIVLALPASTA